MGVAGILEVEKALIGGAFPVYVSMDQQAMLPDGYTSYMSAGVMLCKNTLDLDDWKVFVHSNYRQIVSENVCDPSRVLDAIHIPPCMVRLIVCKITAMSQQRKCLLRG